LDDFPADAAADRLCSGQRHVELGRVDPVCILFFWQFPHFYAIAWMYREDYERAGIRMLPVVEPDGESTARRILLYSLILIPISLVPKFLSMAGNLYLAGALVLGLLFLYAGVRVMFDRNSSASAPCSARLSRLSADSLRLDAA